MIGLYTECTPYVVWNVHTGVAWERYQATFRAVGGLRALVNETNETHQLINFLETFREIGEFRFRNTQVAAVIQPWGLLVCDTDIYMWGVSIAWWHQYQQIHAQLPLLWHRALCRPKITKSQASILNSHFEAWGQWSAYINTAIRNPTPGPLPASLTTMRMRHPKMREWIASLGPPRDTREYYAKVLPILAGFGRRLAPDKFLALLMKQYGH